MCLVVGCNRTPPRGSTICGRCWRMVPVETKLALDGHHEADRNPERWAMSWGETWPAFFARRDEFKQFLGYSYGHTLALAANQAYEARREEALAYLKSIEEEDD